MCSLSAVAVAAQEKMEAVVEPEDTYIKLMRILRQEL
jgi:hypothetical protein